MYQRPPSPPAGGGTVPESQPPPRGWRSGQLGFALAVFAILASTPAGLHARQAPVPATLRGEVLDPSVGRPVVGAVVDALDPQGRIRARAITDEEGAFFLARVEPGSFRLRVRSVGYMETTTPRWWVEEGETLGLVVRVDPDVILLAPLEVVARSRAVSPVLSGFYQRQGRVSGTFINREDIARSNALRVTDLLATVPGIRLQTAGPGFQVIRFSRAPGSYCPAQVFVDGVLASRGNAEVLVDELASPGILEGIEVYHGLASVPPEFLNPSARCGVVALWTHRGG